MMHTNFPRFDHRADFQNHLRHTKPSISAEDRRLIDEAVAAGRVTHIPRGVSGIPLPVFDGKKNAIVNQTSEHWLDKHRARQAAGKMPLDLNEHRAAARRKRMLTMLRNGLTRQKIAESLGLNIFTVRKGIRRAMAEELIAQQQGEGAGE